MFNGGRCRCSIHFTSRRDAKYCNQYVCLSVCLFAVYLSVCLHSFKFLWLNFTKFSVHVDCGCGLVLLWQHCDSLHTSGFVDDAMFSHSGPCGMSCIFISGKSITAWTAAAIPSWDFTYNKHQQLHIVVFALYYYCCCCYYYYYYYYYYHYYHYHFTALWISSRITQVSRY